MKVHWSSKGDFKSLINSMKKYSNLPYEKRLSKVGKMYVDAIRSNTPKESGELANGFSFKVSKDNGRPTVSVTNNSHSEYPELVVGLEKGHGTGTGGYVPGKHFVKKSINGIIGEVSKELDGVIKDVR